MEIIFYLLILVSSWPVGLLLTWLCDDELVSDRKYFLYFTYFLIFLAFGFLIYSFKPSIIFALVYLILVILVLLRRGRKLNKKIKNKS